MRRAARGFADALTTAMDDRAAEADRQPRRAPKARRAGRRGDDVLYPTDEHTEPMQPRR
ncbi:MAG: hypothetical protein AAF322_19420 [Pseudomonadota bacterium]